VKVLDRQGSIVPGNADDLFLSEVRAVDGVFWRVEEGARTVLDFFFGPFSFKDDDRFRSLRMAVGRKSGARGKLS
jgi:hypothetical protein